MAALRQGPTAGGDAALHSAHYPPTSGSIWDVGKGRVITAEVQHHADARLWASVTLSVRPRKEGTKITCKFIPGRESSFCNARWTDLPIPCLPSEIKRFASRIDGPDLTNPAGRARAIESACFSGLRFGTHHAGVEQFEAIVLDAAGYTTGDITPFAVAAAAALVTALRPDLDLTTKDWDPDWRIVKSRAR